MPAPTLIVKKNFFFIFDANVKMCGDVALKKYPIAILIYEKSWKSVSCNFVDATKYDFLSKFFFLFSFSSYFTTWESQFPFFETVYLSYDEGTHQKEPFTRTSSQLLKSIRIFDEGKNDNHAPAKKLHEDIKFSKFSRIWANFYFWIYENRLTT